MFEIPKLVIDLFQIASAVGVAGALIYAGLAYRGSKISEEIKRSYDSFKDLKDLRTSLVEHQEEYQNAFAMHDWYERYFNAWEWFSFMVNKKQIKNEEIQMFFKPSLIDEYENRFKIHFSKELEENDPEFYPQFQQLYKDWTKKKIKVARFD
jgi:hypothetical protein